MVLIVEALNTDFGIKFWNYVKQAKYEHCNKSTGTPQFYRFNKPASNHYPAMIELFTRKIDNIVLPDDAILTPLPIDDDISSLSAILLDDDYYEFLKQGKVVVNDIAVLDAAYTDMQEFIQRMNIESIDVKQLGLIGRSKEQILDEIEETYLHYPHIW